MLTFDFLFSISKGSTKLSSVEIGGRGGGVGMVAISSPSPKSYRLPIYNVVSFDYNLTFSHTAAILYSKMVSIIVFSNYGDVEKIYVNKI